MEKIILDKETKLITSYKDLREYDIKTDLYHERLGSFVRDFERFEIQPYFQRYYVWGKTQKSNFIDTILRGLTIPAIYTYIDAKTGKEVVIDGQQRLTTIKKFYNNEFKLTGLKNEILNGFDYFTLPKEFKIKFENYKIPIVQIENVDTQDLILEIFEKYNTGGIKLNKQEIRNCVFHGNYNSFISELAKYEPFKKVFDCKEVDRMLKEEYVLLFLAFLQDFDVYNGNLSKFIEQHLSDKMEYNNLSDEKFVLKTKDLANKFKKAIDVNLAIFGKNAFKNCLVYNKEKRVMYKSLSKQVFLLQMLGVVDYDSSLLIRNKEAIKKCYEKLILSDDDFTPHYKKQSKVSMNYRFSKWKKEIGQIIDL